ncbi:MAG: DNA polymerase I [Nitrospirae bacterium]|nr:DNA polymerase I [Nitrospirota bacterium]
MSELYLIDGSSYIYRAYYAIKGLSNSKGMPTNAVYGFTNMLLKILNEKRPQLIGIAFDPKGPTKRHEAYEAYKAQRPKMPDSLSVQIPYIHRVVEAFNIPLLLMEGYEADDVIGTTAKRAEEDGNEVIIVSGDKDMFQLITPHVRIYDPMKEKIYTEPDVHERFNVGPSQVVEIMGLMGDAVDNIPGVAGIGEKTAKDLISTYGTIENLLANLEQVKKPKLRSLLHEQADNARLSRELATIHTGLPIDIDYHNLKLSEPDYNKMTELFRELEFFRLLKTLLPVQKEEVNENYIEVSSDAELADILQKVSVTKRCSIYIHGDSPDSMASGISGIGISVKENEAWCVSIHNLEIDSLRPIIENPQIRKYSHDIKRHIILLKRLGLEPKGFVFDSMIASYLINSNRSDHNMEGIVLEYLHVPLITDETSMSVSLTEGHENQRDKNVPPILNSGMDRRGFLTPPEGFSSENTKVSFLCRRADYILRLAEILEQKMIEVGVKQLFDDIEIPLTEVLADMEMAGITVDPDILRMLSKEMDRDMGGMCQRIYFIAGEEFNISSPKQLSVILFERLGLKPLKKTKTGYSTDEGVLTELARQHELPAEILSYRQLAKLKSTYTDALPELINPETKRLHTSFSQTIAATGRLSSSKPNLQNIPIRTEMGLRIREAFTAEEGHVFLSADYSQIELRVLAHLSGDEVLIDAFKNGEDIHTRTAVEVFGLSPDEITPEMRRRAKAVNFGIVYGMSPYGLSADLGISQQEAKKYIDNYFAGHTGVKAFIENTLRKAVEDGYVTTLLNRRRYMPELTSGDNRTKQFGERIAVNTPVQGSAADIIKIAMIKIHKRLRDERFKSKMILQVHDELLLEVPEAELEQVKNLVIEEMEEVMPLAVPLEVDTGVGKNWRDAG